MRKRNSNRSDSAFKMNAQGSIETIIPSQATAVKVDLPTLVSSSVVSSKTIEPVEEDEVANLFRLLQKQIDTLDSTAEYDNIEHELESLREEYDSVIDQVRKAEVAVGDEAPRLIWQQKQYLTELIDFMDHYDTVSLEDVKPEFLSLERALSSIRIFRELNSGLYFSSRIPKFVSDIFSFFAVIQTSSFSFKSPSSLVNYEWIQAGWMWTEEDGNPDMVPLVFQKSVLPIMLSTLKRETFDDESEFRLAFAHCLEITDYCPAQSVVDSLMNQLKRKLEIAFGSGKLNHQTYETLLNDFGFRQSGWRGMAF